MGVIYKKEFESISEYIYFIYSEAKEKGIKISEDQIKETVCEALIEEINKALCILLKGVNDERN